MSRLRLNEATADRLPSGGQFKSVRIQPVFLIDGWHRPANGDGLRCADRQEQAKREALNNEELLVRLADSDQTSIEGLRAMREARFREDLEFEKWVILRREMGGPAAPNVFEAVGGLVQSVMGWQPSAQQRLDDLYKKLDREFRVQSAREGILSGRIGIDELIQESAPRCSVPTSDSFLVPGPVGLALP